MDQAGAMRLELLPQFHDMHFERIGQPIVAIVPDVLVNACSSQHLAWMPQHESQQRFLPGRQIEPVTSPLGATSRQVDLHVSPGE
jgi:hypothetical protein